MPKPAFIVEGQMEKIILGRICNGCCTAQIPNGKDVPLIHIVKKIDAIVRLWGGKYFPIVVLFDREQRKESAEDIRSELLRMLSEFGHGDQIRVGIADRNFESWLTACPDSVAAHFGLSTKDIYHEEGRNGKTYIKSLLPKGKTYVEKIDGVSIFFSANLNDIYHNSSSFRDFVNSVDIECHFLRNKLSLNLQ